MRLKLFAFSCVQLSSMFSPFPKRGCPVCKVGLGISISSSFNNDGLINNYGAINNDGAFNNDDSLRSATACLIDNDIHYATAIAPDTIMHF